VVAGHGGHHVCPAHAGFGLVPAFAAIVGDHDAAQLIGDLPRTVGILLDDHNLVPGSEELAGQVIAHLSASDDDHVHAPNLLTGVAHGADPCRLRLAVLELDTFLLARGGASDRVGSAARGW